MVLIEGAKDLLKIRMPGADNGGLASHDGEKDTAVGEPRVRVRGGVALQGARGRSARAYVDLPVQASPPRRKIGCVAVRKSGSAGRSVDVGCEWPIGLLTHNAKPHISRRGRQNARTDTDAHTKNAHRQTRMHSSRREKCRWHRHPRSCTQRRCVWPEYMLRLLHGRVSSFCAHDCVSSARANCQSNRRAGCQPNRRGALQRRLKNRKPRWEE
ncbi:hypothetical protein PLICRDRAFT_434402 [Plicaturopsis crispa FD-325 SS-3]|uniref:Uncharacterized protein n=1 Tax=Plicaturopsis crispa FD-325 SS-3 TaxID=944288 RepID=A0A0C9T757_PLICR|nr:hypothetical protein PLICRDRAFT_434402 [Plicaturopsis crispa FD-325 SS-3]